MDNYIPSEAYQQFESWYKENPELITNLQDWLFYLYFQIQKEENLEETKIEVADMTVYLELFYFSTKNGNKYNYNVTLKELAETLETEERVVKHALDSLERHHAITYTDVNGNLSISITPIEAPHEHHHEHHHDHDHDHEHCDHDHDHDHCDHHHE